MYPELGALVVGIGVSYLLMMAIEYATIRARNRLQQAGIKLATIALAAVASCLIAYLFFLLPAHISCWSVQKAAASLVDNIDTKVKVLGRPPQAISDGLAAMNSTAIGHMDYFTTQTEYALLFPAVLLRGFYRVSTVYSSRLRSWIVNIDPDQPVQPDSVPVSRRQYVCIRGTGNWSFRPYGFPRGFPYFMRPARKRHFIANTSYLSSDM